MINFSEQIFTESVWATGIASIVFACVILGVMMWIERIIK